MTGCRTLQSLGVRTAAVPREEPETKHFIRLEQMRQWLAEEGFAIENEYGGHHQEPMGENLCRAVILARRV